MNCFYMMITLAFNDISDMNRTLLLIYIFFPYNLNIRHKTQQNKGYNFGKV